jgi:hypothetical protein
LSTINDSFFEELANIKVDNVDIIVDRLVYKDYSEQESADTKD